MRATEERRIYEKLLQGSELAAAPCAPHTLDLLSRLCVLSRLKGGKVKVDGTEQDIGLHSKMRAYNGDTLRDIDTKAASVQEYREAAGVDEGMEGISTRFAFKVLSGTFNFDAEETAADPVYLMYVIEQAIFREQFPDATEKKYLNFIKAELSPRYAEFIGEEIQKAYLESYTGYGQELFETYAAYADAWKENQDYKHPETGQIMTRETLSNELSKIEKPSGISNPKDFRENLVTFVLRARAKNGGAVPDWKTLGDEMRRVFERKMFSKPEDLIPVISFGTKRDMETQEKHDDFVRRMVASGYTERQVRRLVEWYMRVNKAG